MQADIVGRRPGHPTTGVSRLGPVLSLYALGLGSLGYLGWLVAGLVVREPVAWRTLAGLGLVTLTLANAPLLFLRRGDSEFPSWEDKP